MAGGANDMPRAGISLEKKRLKGNPLAVPSYVMGRCREDGKMCSGRTSCTIQLAIRKNFPMRLVKCWNRLPRQGVGSSSIFILGNAQSTSGQGLEQSDVTVK